MTRLCRRLAQCNKGISLIEMMVAVFILMFSMLGILSLMANSVSVNASNEIRNTAVRLTNQTAEALQSLGFNDAELTTTALFDCPVGAATFTGTLHTRATGNLNQDLRGFPQLAQTIRSYQQPYAISWCVTDMDAFSKQVHVTIAYTFRGENLSNEQVIYLNKTM